jgi:hypothetical protein
MTVNTQYQIKYTYTLEPVPLVRSPKMLDISKLFDEKKPKNIGAK